MAEAMDVSGFEVYGFGLALEDESRQLGERWGQQPDRLLDLAEDLARVRRPETPAETRDEIIRDVIDELTRMAEGMAAMSVRLAEIESHKAGMRRLAECS